LHSRLRVAADVGAFSTDYAGDSVKVTDGERNATFAKIEKNGQVIPRMVAVGPSLSESNVADFIVRSCKSDISGRPRRSQPLISRCLGRSWFLHHRFPVRTRQGRGIVARSAAFAGIMKGGRPPRIRRPNSQPRHKPGALHPARNDGDHDVWRYPPSWKYIIKHQKSKQKVPFRRIRRGAGEAAPGPAMHPRAMATQGE